MRTFASVVLLFLIISAVGQAQSLQLFVDLTEAPRNIFHSKMAIPVSAGPLTLVYPKWIPGNHRPSGPIANFTGLRVEAAGKPIPWQRDDVDMYAFHVEVPAGVSELTVFADTITIDGSAGASGASASSTLLDLNWNQVVLYPAGVASDDVQVTASIRLPSGWKFATALPPARPGGQDIAFQPVSLTTLVDSPLIAGQYFREILLQEPGKGPLHFLDLVGESEAAINAPDNDLTAYRNLVNQAAALFGAHHFRQYHFLLTLTDEAGHHGVEHHESSDNSVAERMFSDPDLHLLEAGLLPHEYVHSWNGKYRRPAGLATRNYQDPMRADLLWVYEGLTEYLGDVLAARSGLISDEQYREGLAQTAAMLDHRRGRTWRPLADTARSVQILRLQGANWESWRRTLDYYPEGELIWLEVDTLIRQQTKGAKSLDDFCRTFHGGESGAPRLSPYTFQDVVTALNARYSLRLGEALAGAHAKTPAHMLPLAALSKAAGNSSTTTSPMHLWLQLKPWDEAATCLTRSESNWTKMAMSKMLFRTHPAARAGIAPRMKVLAVNERRWSKKVMLDALRRPPRLISRYNFSSKTPSR